MKSLYFSKPGTTQNFWRCGICKADFAMQGGGYAGTNVMVGNQLHAIVCDQCLPSARRSVDEAMPHSFPDVDDKGRLLL